MEVTTRMPQAAGNEALTKECSGSVKSMQRSMPALKIRPSVAVTTKFMMARDSMGWCFWPPAGMLMAEATCGSEPEKSSSTVPSPLAVTTSLARMGTGLT